MLLFCRSWLPVFSIAAFHPLLAVFRLPSLAFLLPFFISCLPFMYVLLQVVLSVLFVSVFRL